MSAQIGSHVIQIWARDGSGTLRMVVSDWHQYRDNGSTIDELWHALDEDTMHWGTDPELYWIQRDSRYYSGREGRYDYVAYTRRERIYMAAYNGTAPLLTGAAYDYTAPIIVLSGKGSCPFYCGRHDALSDSTGHAGETDTLLAIVQSDDPAIRAGLVDFQIAPAYDANSKTYSWTSSMGWADLSGYSIMEIAYSMSDSLQALV